MKLTKGKKLVVLFGAATFEDFFREKSKKAEGKEVEDRVWKYDEWKTEVIKNRQEIVTELNKSREVRDVSDLFVKLPGILLFNPVIFRVHIPSSLQKQHYVMVRERYAKVEDFDVVFDGGILMIAALCDLGKYPWGALDVRDKFVEIFGSIRKVKTIPPCLSPVQVTFLKEGDSDEIAIDELTFTIPKSVRVETSELLGNLYVTVHNTLGQFFSVCQTRISLEEKGSAIMRSEQRMLRGLTDFLETDWKQFNKQRKLTAQIKLEMAQLLVEVSSYNYLKNTLERRKRDVHRSLEREESFAVKLVKRIGLSYVEPRSVIDTVSMIRNAEHTRNEIGTYSISVSTIISAFIGGVIGSVVTYILSLIR